MFVTYFESFCLREVCVMEHKYPTADVLLGLHPCPFIVLNTTLTNGRSAAAAALETFSEVALSTPTLLSRTQHSRVRATLDVGQNNVQVAPGSRILRGRRQSHCPRTRLRAAVSSDKEVMRGIYSRRR